jgi:cystathionine beta-lyase
MTYDFDEIIERRNTGSLKYDLAVRRGKPEGVLPLWVADMDFRTPQCVIDALVERSRTAYSATAKATTPICRRTEWYTTNFGFLPKQEWLLKTQGIVFAVCAVPFGAHEKGRRLLIQQPVYYPFPRCVRDNERK